MRRDWRETGDACRPNFLAAWSGEPAFCSVVEAGLEAVHSLCQSIAGKVFQPLQQIVLFPPTPHVHENCNSIRSYNIISISNHMTFSHNIGGHVGLYEKTKGTRDTPKAWGSKFFFLIRQNVQ